jgi:hypothetical protein
MGLSQHKEPSVSTHEKDWRRPASATDRSFPVPEMLARSKIANILEVAA